MNKIYHTTEKEQLSGKMENSLFFDLFLHPRYVDNPNSEVSSNTYEEESNEQPKTTVTNDND
ncbi:MAG: hypothetical protein V3R25_08605, partial [Nitrosomonadaceae bacterium]